MQVTGRGHRGADHELVMDYLRSIHPNTARKVTIAKATGIRQDRIMIIMNNLSGICGGDIKEALEGKAFDFLVYDHNDNGPTEYGIAKDTKTGIFWDTETVNCA